MSDNKEYFKNSLLNDIDTLKEYIENEEPHPESEFNMETISHVKECIDEALSVWHY